MLGSYVASDLELSSLSISTVTLQGSKLFSTQLLSPSVNIKELNQKQLPLLSLRRVDLAPLQKSLREFATTESVLQDITCDHSIDPLLEETTEQIVWNKTSNFGRILNQSPLLLESLVFWKTICLPLFTILIPICAVLIPYFLVQQTTQEYMETLRTMVRGAITVPSMLQAKGTNDKVGFVIESVYICITIGIFVSSIWNQITSALHLRSIASSLREKGTIIRSGITHAESIFTILSNYPAKIKKGIQQLLMEGKKVLEPFHNTVDTGIGLFARLYNDASAVLPLLQWVGKVDVYTSIASLTSICFPRWTTDTTEFTNIYHPMLKNPTLNTVSLQPHAILTGPNRGGKSTICKAIGLSIVCAQSWGFAFASKANLTPFARIETALSPADTVGRLSLFETEIEFAKTVVEASERPLFVMMDEIFHSTNAHDGVEASRVFLNRLYKLPNTVSLISTHYRVLAEEYTTVQSLQVEAISTETGLKYTYQVIPGISTKSSVMEILQERGLLCAEQSNV